MATKVRGFKVKRSSLCPETRNGPRRPVIQNVSTITNLVLIYNKLVDVMSLLSQTRSSSPPQVHA